MILYFGGCLGREVFNIAAFVFYIPKLNKTLQQGKCSSYLSNNMYCKFYRESSFAQTRMIVLRSIELLICDIIILVVLSNDTQAALILRIIFLYATGAIIFTPLFWLWMLKAHIIDFEENNKTYADIFHAIVVGEVQDIEIEFNSLQNIYKQDEDGNTPLHYSCMFKKFDITAWLANDSGFMDESSINRVNNNQETPLYVACKFGSLKCVQALFDSNHNIKIDALNSNNETIVFVASKYGHLKILNYLFNKLNINTTNGTILNQITMGESDTALHAASRNGHYRVVELLLQQKNIDIIINMLNNNENAAIHESIANGHDTTSNLLLNDPRSKLSKQSMEKLWYYVVKFDNVEIMKLLLDDKENEFNIHSPCIVTDKSDSEHNYNTPFLNAVWNNSANVIRLIAKQDPNVVNKTDSNGKSPLYVACEMGNSKSALALLEMKEVDLLFKINDTKTSILHATCKGRSKEIFTAVTSKIRIVHGAKRLKQEMRRRNRSGDTALHIACSYNAHQIVMEMSQVFSDMIDFASKNNRGQTAIEIAQHRNYTETIEVFQLVQRFAMAFDDV